MLENGVKTKMFQEGFFLAVVVEILHNKDRKSPKLLK